MCAQALACWQAGKGGSATPRPLPPRPLQKEETEKERSFFSAPRSREVQALRLLCLLAHRLQHEAGLARRAIAHLGGGAWRAKAVGYRRQRRRSEGGGGTVGPSRGGLGLPTVRASRAAKAAAEKLEEGSKKKKEGSYKRAALTNSAKASSAGLRSMSAGSSCSRRTSGMCGWVGRWGEVGGGVGGVQAYRLGASGPTTPPPKASLLRLPAGFVPPSRPLKIKQRNPLSPTHLGRCRALPPPRRARCSLRTAPG